MRKLALTLLLLLALPAAADDDALWIDVRTPEEYAAGHLVGAINIPHDQIAARIAEVTRDPQQPIRLYCRVGRRAQMAKVALEARGYDKVTNEGGFDDLRARVAAAGSCGTNC